MLGYQDKDLGVLENTAHLEVLENTTPTASRRARQLFLPQAARHRWRKTKRDMRNAFLWADSTREKRDEYLDPETAPFVSEYFNAQPGEALQVWKPAYGSIHAPRMWWQRVQKNITQFGLIPMEIEPCVWGALYQQEHGHSRLIGEILVHVDDCLFAGGETSAK